MLITLIIILMSFPFVLLGYDIYFRLRLLPQIPFLLKSEGLDELSKQLSAIIDEIGLIHPRGTKSTKMKEFYKVMLVFTTITISKSNYTLLKIQKKYKYLLLMQKWILLLFLIVPFLFIVLIKFPQLI